MIHDPAPAAAGDSAAAVWVSAIGRESARASSISNAVLGLPGVAALSAGEYGRFGTFGAGRYVPGVRVDDTQINVHIVAQFGIPLHTTASEIGNVLQPWLNGRTFQVAVDDILLPGEELLLDEELEVAPTAAEVAEVTRTTILVDPTPVAPETIAQRSSP